jgi:hypothetical protein
MKLIMLMTTLMFSFSALAYLNEVECEKVSRHQQVRVEIERPFPANSMTKEAKLYITQDGYERLYHSRVMTYRSRGFSDVRYEGGGLQLEVNFWPDQRPQQWRTYKGRLISFHLGNRYLHDLDCKFPYSY